MVGSRTCLKKSFLEVEVAEVVEAEMVAILNPTRLLS